MAVKISRGGWVLMFLGTGLVAYGLNRYGLRNLVRLGFSLGLLRSGKGRANYREISVANKPRTELVAITTPALARETPGSRRSEKIRRRAHELYLQRGSQPGSQLDDWLRAEAEILRAEGVAIDEASANDRIS